jgi:dTMP kinase
VSNQVNQKGEAMIPNLETTIVEGLTVRNPLGIASGPQSENIESLKRLVEYRPGFITLKTTIINPSFNVNNGSRIMQPLRGVNLTNSFYSNGEKELELLSVEKTNELLLYCKKNLPTTKVGVSLSIIEDPSSLFQEWRKRNLEPDYIEVSDKSIKKLIRHEKFRNDFSRFCDESHAMVIEAIKGMRQKTNLPIIVKLSRDMPWVLSWSHVNAILLGDPSIGLCLFDVPSYVMIPDPYKGFKYSMADGIQIGHYSGTINGEHNFLPTYSMMVELLSIGYFSTVVTGGMMNGNHVISTIAAGAKAVQLCSALVVHGFSHYKRIYDRLVREVQNTESGDINELRGRFQYKKQGEQHILRKCVVIHNKCKKCGKCRDFCEFLDKPGHFTSDKCIGCQRCLASCNFSARIILPSSITANINNLEKEKAVDLYRDYANSTSLPENHKDLFNQWLVSEFSERMKEPLQLSHISRIDNDIDTKRKTKLITIEGCDGSGKSSLVNNLSSILKNNDLSVLSVKEFGDINNSFSVKLMKIALSEDYQISDWINQLLFAIIARDHHNNFLIPEMKSNKWDVILSDRGVFSFFAYSKVMIGDEYLQELIHKIGYENMQLPDIAFFLDIDPIVARKRIYNRQIKTGKPIDKIEEKGILFQQQLRSEFHFLARLYPDKLKIVSVKEDSSPEDVTRETLHLISKMILGTESKNCELDKERIILLEN